MATVAAPDRTVEAEKRHPYAMALLSPTGGGLRRRSGSDVARVVVAILLLVAMGFSYGASTYVFGALAQWVYPVPHLLSWLLTALWFVGSIGIIVLMVCVVAIARRFEVLRDLVVATALSWLGCVAIQAGLGVSLGLPHDSATTFRGFDLGFPAVLLALTSGICLVARPYLSRSLQRLVEINLALLVITGFLHGAGLPFSLVAAIALGWAAAALTHLFFGVPIPIPSADQVKALLAELKITTGSVMAVPYQQWGLTRFTGRNDAGQTLRISLYSRDARQSQLFAKIYRNLMYRHDVAPFALTRQQQIEHEAYLTLLAQRAAPGCTSELVATEILGPSREALVVSTSPAGSLLHELYDAGKAPSTAAVSSMAATLKMLHDQGIAHGSVDFDHVVVDGDRAGLVNFDRGVGDADAEVLSRDVAALLVTASLVTSTKAAVPAVMAELGAPAVTDALPLLQNPALPASLNAALHHGKHRGLLKEVRETGARAAGVDVPEVQQLGRFNLNKLVVAGGSLLGLYALVGVLLKSAQSASTIGHANLPWVIATALVAALTFVGAAYATLGTIPGTAPLWPLILLEVSNTFTALTFTGAVTATRIRFFQRQGMSATVAVTSGALGGVSSWTVKIVLALISLPFALGKIDLHRLVKTSGGHGAHINWGLILTIVIAIVVVLGVLLWIAFKLPKSRAAIESKVRPKYEETKGHIKELAHKPSKLVEMFGGQAASQLLTAIALGTALEAFGHHLALAVLFLVVVIGGILGGLAPVPGGMGVVEAGTILGLKACGIPADDAVAAVFVQRVFTGYLPPVAGWFALMALRHRNDL
jgi:uncharacterized membrane protein YbhN (UPF0104 family)